MTRVSRIRGTLLGTAVGDALGLPSEGISRRRAQKLFKGRWRHRLILNRGMISDDTEHTLFVAQSLIAHATSLDRFQRRLAWSLRWWLVALPAGVGFATLRAILRLWLGFRPSVSGIASAGNGPAMRVAPIGALFAESPSRLDEFVTAATRITHTDSRALTGATAIALMVAWTVRDDLTERPDIDDFVSLLLTAGPNDSEWLGLLDAIRRGHRQEDTVEQFAADLGLQTGVTGYVYHTVPVAAYAWFRHFGDFEKTLTSVLDCGGDTDTTGAIVGALAGAVVGDQGLPRRWIDGIVDWPRGPKLLFTVADRLAAVGVGEQPVRPVRYCWPMVPLRNLLYLIVVLLHGLRRLAPPY